ncbi:MAG TPA: cell division/cell wall cluster transcriptional repressor MraZ [Patescibacteria group bacterium]|nr:cell division/cell wall cluster transcriptional repressor MraZ [Patescibacteria group bacterium]
MLIGSYLGNISDARRVAVPKKFLKELGEKPIVAKWYEDCLILVSPEFWEKLLARLTGGGKTINLGVRDIERFILGSAFETEPDEQGRIVIPEILAHYARLGKETVFVGLGDRVEIWAKDAWDEKTQTLAKTTRQYIEDIKKDE